MNTSELIVKQVLKNVSEINKRQLTTEEKLYIVRGFRQINTDLYMGKNVNDIISVLSNTFSQELKRMNSQKEPEIIDIKELMITQMGKNPETMLIQPVINDAETVDSLIKEPLKIQSIFNPDALRRSAFLRLDRKYQTQSTNNINTFKWSIAVISEGANYDPTTSAATTSSLTGIVECHIRPFRFPNTLNALNGRRRLSLQILEFSNQGWVLAPSTRRIQFIMELVQTDNTGLFQYDAKDIGQNRTEFKFFSPIMQLPTITLQFGNPETILNLDPDNGYTSVAASGVQSLLTFFQKNSDGTYTATAHNCAVNDLVMISNFNTTDPSGDRAEITLMNDTNGWPIATIPSATTMLINIDISGLAGAIVGSPFPIYLDSKRFCIEMRLTYLASSDKPY